MPVDLLSCGKDVIGLSQAFWTVSSGQWTILRYTVEEMPHMNPQDLSAYITSLLRSGPEIIASFMMGIFFTGMLSFRSVAGCFLVVIPENELARKERKNRKKPRDRQDGFADRQSRSETGVPGREAVGEGRSFQNPPLESMTLDIKVSGATSRHPLTSRKPRLAVAELEAENKVLVQDKQFLEQASRI